MIEKARTRVFVDDRKEKREESTEKRVQRREYREESTEKREKTQLREKREDRRENEFGRLRERMYVRETRCFPCQ